MPNFRRVTTPVEARQYLDDASGSDILSWLAGAGVTASIDANGIEIPDVQAGNWTAAIGDWVVKPCDQKFLTVQATVFPCIYDAHS